MALTRAVSLSLAAWLGLTLLIKELLLPTREGLLGSDDQQESDLHDSLCMCVCVSVSILHLRNPNRCCLRDTNAGIQGICVNYYVYRSSTLSPNQGPGL